MEDKQTLPADSMDMDINADADIPGNTHLSNPENDIDTELLNLTSELEEQKDKYLRLAAEFDNYKRRTAKEKIEMIQTAGRETISSLLDVLDDMDRAEKQMESSEDIAVVKEGNRIVFNKLRNVMLQKGVKAMESIQTEFDVEKHEAITEVQAGDKMKGRIVDEVIKGYYLNDKLIRFAKVVVGK
ncbi:MAG: nucleotide exchange factor GrpE [Ferruginibacter sp.]